MKKSLLCIWNLACTPTQEVDITMQASKVSTLGKTNLTLVNLLDFSLFSSAVLTRAATLMSIQDGLDKEETRSKLWQFPVEEEIDLLVDPTPVREVWIMIIRVKADLTILA